MNAVSTKVEITVPCYSNMGWKDREYEQDIDGIWEMTEEQQNKLLEEIIQDQVNGTPHVQAKVTKFAKKTFVCSVARFEVHYKKFEPQRPDRGFTVHEAIVSFM